MSVSLHRCRSTAIPSVPRCPFWAATSPSRSSPAARSPTPRSTTPPAPPPSSGSGTTWPPTPRTTAACTAAPATSRSSPPTSSRTAARTVAEFLGCRADDQVVFTRSTTDSLNLLAAALPGRLPGLRLRDRAPRLAAALARTPGSPTSTRPRTPAQAVATLERALAGRDPDGPALVCVTGASNVTGELWPVRELAAAAHAHGARIVLDAAQLAPHHPVDIARARRRLGRLLRAQAVRALRLRASSPGRADWLRDAEPYLAGGGASRKVARRADGGVDVEWHDHAPPGTRPARPTSSAPTPSPPPARRSPRPASTGWSPASSS